MTKTGGRSASLRHIMGEAALAVGMPKSPTPKGWEWVALTDVARLESGHTPSRNHPEYWGGEIPWLSIRDAKAHHAGTIRDTIEYTNELGITNSSARILPSGTVCLSRTASVGYVVVMGRPMATSQDFVNWVCSKQLEPRFLQYLLVFEGPSLSRFSSGAVHQTIYFPEAKAFHICLPSLEEQRRIVALLDEAHASIAIASANAERNLANARELFCGAIDKYFATDRWPRHQLASLAAIFDDGDWVESKDQSPQGIRLIQTGNIGNGYFKDRAEKARYISDATFKRLRCTEILPGDCLVSRLPDPVGRACIIPDTGERMITAVDCTIVRFKPDALPAELFCYYSQSSEYAAQVAKRTTGATRLRISRSNLAAVNVPVPRVSDQDALLAKLKKLDGLIASLQDAQRQKLKALDSLGQSLLHRAFSGALTVPATVLIAPVNDNFATPEFAAQLLAFAHARHVARGCPATFGHVKAQKTLHAIEAIGGLDLGRRPIRDAAGPNDFAQMRQAENWAKQQGFFEFVQRTSGGYDFRPLQNYGELIDEAKRRVEQAGTAVTQAVEFLVDMDSDWAEIVMTTHAAWNNLILDSARITDDAIVQSARDDWHPAKLRHDLSRFHDAIRFIRRNGIEPDGSAKRVGGQESLPL